MKLKSWVVWVFVVAFLVTEVFLFSANRQKDATRVALREARQQVDQLQAQLDQLKSSNMATLNADSARLRAENQNLSQKFAQLQSENGQLRQQNQKLNQQLSAASNTLQQQQAQLQEMQLESQQAQQQSETMSGSGQSPSAAAQQNACINNLRQIDAAKQQWALENNKPADAIPTVQDLLPYFQDGVFPVCPSGGSYTINPVGMLPTCSVPGHALPLQ